MKNFNWHLIKRLMVEFTKPRLPLIFLAAFFMLIFAAANTQQIVIVKEILSKIFKERNDSLRHFLPLKIITLYVIYGFSNYASNVIMNYVGFGVVNSMQKNLFAHIIGSDMEFHYRKSSGELISRINNDIGLIKGAIIDIVIVSFKQFFSIAGIVGYMFYQDWRLSVVAFSVLIFVIYPTMRVAKRLRKLARQGQEQAAHLTNIMNESFTGIRIVKAYQNEYKEISRISLWMDKTFKTRIKGVKVSGINGPIMSILSGCAIASVIWYVGYTSDKGKQAEIISFVLGLIMLMRPAKGMSNINNILQNAIVAADRYYSIIDYKPKLVDYSDAADLVVKGAEIELHNVNFEYVTEHGQNVKALNNLSMVIPAGKRVALVGPSGSGKSTIINLLLRFFEPESGHVTIDGQDITKIKISSLRCNISLVTQDVFLFDDTIAANIAYGVANASDEQIESAAKMAVADEFIKALPNGYQTLVGENGIRLSGGQKQRISIARALLRDTKILLLDEATSSLDSVSEREFQHALENLMHGKTTLMIAHRLSTVINADLIYVLDSGNIVTSGTHEELMKESAAYRSLFNM